MQSEPEAGADARAILDSLRRIVRDLRRPATGPLTTVSAAQLFVLDALGTGEALSVNELADRTYTHQSSVSVVVRTLAERGYVARRTADDDKRRAELTLTPAGRTALRRAPRAPQVRLLAGIARLSPDSRRRLSATLAELVRAMDLHGEPPEMFFTDEAPARGGIRARS